MGKNARRRKEAKLAANPKRPHLPPRPRGVTDAEVEAVQMIGALSDPSNPPCPGPVAVHADGSFECTAEGCDGVSFRYHDDDAPAPCNHDSVPAVVHTCRRCADVKPVRDGDGPDNAVKAGTFTGIAVCTGMGVDHDDGTMTCTLGDDCGDPGAMHGTTMSCSLVAGGCDRC